MARTPRVDVGGEIYHVINRANGRLKIFHNEKDYQAFEALLVEIKELFDIDILAYVVMPNHWHLLLRPKQDGDLSRVLQWLGTTHTRRVHAHTKTIGGGHLYQGRYKSFLVQGGKHFLTVLKYIERNPVRAKLVPTVQQWKWGSAYRRVAAPPKDRTLITPSPEPLPRNYLSWVNQAESTESLDELRKSVTKGIPSGSDSWQETMITKYHLQASTRDPGRPKIL